MKTFLTIILVWAVLSAFATALVLFRAWWNSRQDPDDAASNDSKS